MPEGTKKWSDFKSVIIGHRWIRQRRHRPRPYSTFLQRKSPLSALQMKPWNFNFLPQFLERSFFCFAHNAEKGGSSRTNCPPDKTGATKEKEGNIAQHSLNQLIWFSQRISVQIDMTSSLQPRSIVSAMHWWKRQLNFPSSNVAFSDRDPPTTFVFSTLDFLSTMFLLKNPYPDICAHVANKIGFPVRFVAIVAPTERPRPRFVSKVNVCGITQFCWQAKRNDWHCW